MAVTETEVIGGGSKMMNSLKGMLGGLALIPLSFGVVWYASQRAQASEELAGALSVAERAKAAQEGRAVYATGKIQAQPLGDAPYIKPGTYLSLNRTAEVYAWKETKKTEETKDGTQTVKKTTYDCKLEWVSNPSSAYGEKGCQGKPRYAVRGSDNSQSARIALVAGGQTYAIDESVDDYGFASLSLADSDLADGSLTLNNNEIYFDSACASSPREGCQRLSYSGTAYDPQADHTVVGQEEGGRFAEFKEFLVIGVGDYTQTMESVSSADTLWTLGLFALSVIFLGGGLALLVGPLLQLIEFIPFIGGFGAGLIRFIFFAFAFVFMGVVFLLIEYWYLVLLLFVIGIIATVVIARNRKAAAATA